MCSGDYFHREDYKAFSPYLMLTQGKFLKIYSIVVFSLAGLILCLGSCIFSCTMMKARLDSKLGIDDFIKHMDPPEEMMRQF